MIDDIRTDKIALRASVSASLERLLSQNYISRNGDTYAFLTDEEQDDGFYYKYNEKVLFRTDSKTQMEYLKNGVSGSLMQPRNISLQEIQA